MSFSSSRVLGRCWSSATASTTTIHVTEGVARLAALAIIAALLLATRPTFAQIPEEYEITAVIVGPFCNDTFHFAPTTGHGINADGVVTGYHKPCALGPDTPFIWTEQGGVVNIPMPTGFQSGRAFGIDGALTVGYASFADDDLGIIAFMYNIDSGDLEIVGVPDGGTYSQLAAVSNARAVGNWGNNVVGNPAFEAFIWQNAVFTSLAPDLGTAESQALAINTAGLVTGWMGESSPAFDGNAYIWHEGEVTILPVVPGGFTSSGLAINEHGDVAGWGAVFDKDIGDEVARAFAYIDGVMNVIDPLPGFPGSKATSISDNGLVVGHTDGLTEAFIWYEGELVPLDDLIDPASGIDLDNPKEIRADGTILCDGLTTLNGRADQDVTVVLTPIFPPVGDLDDDGVVGSSDLIILLGAWGRCRGECIADLDGDGVVGTGDLILLLGNWG